MIYRIFSDKDTFITNFRRDNVAQTGSNVGSSEMLYLFRVAPVSTSLGEVSGSSARILAKFELAGFSALTASTAAPSTGVSYRLRMKHVKHRKTLPASFDVELFPVTTDWDEGRGVDVDNYADKGVANWDKPKSNVFWTAAGGDFTGSLRAVAHFDKGDEDLSINVTHIVNAWLTGGLPNYGFMVKMSSTLETGNTDYFIKMFHGRETNFAGREPYLEASWDDSRKDDRNNFVYGYTGSLFLYNRVRGQLTDIPNVNPLTNVITVKIVDASGTIKTVSGSHTGITGIYSASFAIATASYSGSTFSDVWFSGSLAFVTGTFIPTGNFSLETSRVSQYFVSMPNLKNQYEGDEVVRMNLFVRDRDYNPSVVLTGSSGPTGKVVTKAWYRVDNDRTDEIVVPFGTGSVETTRLSYDRDGNYFGFYMSSLTRGCVYRIVYLLDIDGQRQLVDNDFKFRVV